MPYNATVLMVMIASPRDVVTERNIIRGTIHDWNAINSADRNLILLPVGWDSNAAPEMGDRAQTLLNKQLLENCDLLVAVFWTRLGSPTGEAPSGTVEEIEEHLAAGKPAMLYFSNAPMRPDSVDDEQYQALKACRAEFEKRGLIQTYESLEEFREKFSRQLAQTVIREFSKLGAPETAEISVSAVKPSPSLSETARQLLLETALDHDGVVLSIRVRGGLMVQTNGKQLARMGDARDEALWKGAIEELLDSDLMEARGERGEVFALTAKGFSLAEQIAKVGPVG